MYRTMGVPYHGERSRPRRQPCHARPHTRICSSKKALNYDLLLNPSPPLSHHTNLPPVLRRPCFPSPGPLTWELGRFKQRTKSSSQTLWVFRTDTFLPLLPALRADAAHATKCVQVMWEFLKHLLLGQRVYRSTRAVQRFLSLSLSLYSFLPSDLIAGRVVVGRIFALLEWIFLYD